MRFKHSEYVRRSNGDLRVEFVDQDLSGYSGLELFRRYFRLIQLNSCIRQAFREQGLKGDYGLVPFTLVFVALWLTGGRRLRHIGFLSDDPLVKRPCGLARIPSDRSASRWLRQFTNQSLQALVALNSEIVTNKLKALGLPRLTLDFDGSVLTCGHTVGWAFRGYNPHKRYAPSYYPLLCHIAQTGHFLEVKNRPGNIHDSKGALEVIRRCVDQLRAALIGVTLEARLDAAFFQKEILGWLDRHGNFQVDTRLALVRPRTVRRTNLFSFSFLATLRFEWIAAAGRLVNRSGAQVLKLCHNARRRERFQSIAYNLDRLVA